MRKSQSAETSLISEMESFLFPIRSFDEQRKGVVLAPKSRPDEFAEYVERTLMLLQYLARRRGHITYGELAKALGLTSEPSLMIERNTTPLLAQAFYIAKRRNWPPITSLVVSATTGLPGEGYWYEYSELVGLNLSKEHSVRLALTRTHHSQVFSYFSLER